RIDSYSHTNCCRFHLTVFSSITRPPPTPTLFPYTTLFRSLDGDARAVVAVRDALDAGGQGRQISREPSRDGDDDYERDRDEQQSDRKSTRLNSSHVSISYAVFCLKKKNIYYRYAQISACTV